MERTIRSTFLASKVGRKKLVYMQQWFSTNMLSQKVSESVETKGNSVKNIIIALATALILLIPLVKE